jgi:hypothetical protein
VNCEHCDRELNSWKDGFQHEFGYEEWEESDPCENGCDVLSEIDFSESIEYFRFRDSVIKLINSSTKKSLELKGTIDSLDDHIAQWWDEVGKEQFYKENT